MNLFLRDLWHDLREKRLWPVAIALLAGVIAVPVLLLDSSGGEDVAPPAVPAAQTPPGADEAALVALDEESSAAGSRLDHFDPKDPFKPRGVPRLKATDEAGGESKAAGGSGKSDSAVKVPPGAPPTAPDVAGTPAVGDESKPRPVSYTYVADVRFGRRAGTPRRYDALRKLDVLPRSGAPMLVFLGVSPTGKSAIFLVDASLRQRGDGRCLPSRDECTFLHLTTEEGHDLHYLETAEGVEYSIRLLDIRRVRTALLAAQARRAKKSSRARAKASGNRPSRRRAAARPAFGADEIVYAR